MSKKVLVVDDDSHIREVIIYALAKVGIKLIEAKNGKDALQAVQVHQPDLIVLDITMPEMDGLEVCKELRKASEIPILFLSARDEEIDKIIGLEIGGDDYVTKPFSPRELVARVNVIFKRLNRTNIQKAQTKTLNYGQIQLDLDRYIALWKEQLVVLTATEFSLLQAFLKQPFRVHTRDSLINSSYDYADIVCDRTIDSHIRRIRSKFAALGGASVIETVHGIGYKLGSCQ
jgi:two-component system, OmpR family, response regulator